MMLILISFIHDGGVFRQNRDAFFSLQRVAVHNTFDGVLIITEDMALLEQGIDEGRFAVVDMGDDSDVSDVITILHNTCFYPY